MGSSGRGRRDICVFGRERERERERERICG